MTKTNNMVKKELLKLGQTPTVLKQVRACMKNIKDFDQINTSQRYR